MHAEVLPWTVGEPRLVSITPAVFLLECGHADRQTSKQTNRQIELNLLPLSAAIQPAWNNSYSLEKLPDSFTHQRPQKSVKLECCSTVPIVIKHVCISNDLVMRLQFFTARAMLSRYMPWSCVCVSVCVSVCVCLSQVGVLLKWLNIGKRKQRHTIAQGL